MALINLRNALMAGKRLPYDAEVEFLESTGTQYIDTGFKANTATTRLEASIEFTNPTSTQGVFGSRNDDTGNLKSCNAFILASNIFRPDWAAGSGGSTNNITISPNTIYEISITRGRLTLNGTVYTYPTSASVEQEYNFLLFNFSNAGSVFSSGLKGRLRYAKIYSNDTLVRDYIPVRKGTVGYLYERVSGKLFGNAGTGDFLYGADVVPVEYIESHGTEYIDTGLTFTTATVADISLITTPTSIPTRDAFFYGLQNLSLGNIALETYNSQIFLAAGQKEKSAGAATAGAKYNFSAHYESGNSWLKINGSTAATIADSFSQISPRSLWLFARNNGTNTHPCLARMERFVVSLNGTSACNYHPVRVGTGSTWEGALIDTLTRRIYRNAGTGAFTYGNDLPYPIPAS